MSSSSGHAMHCVLCLHGYTQNAKKFRDRTGPFRRNMKRRMELVYMTAPLDATVEFERSGGSNKGGGGDSSATDNGEEEGPSAAWWNPRATAAETWGDIRRSAEAVMRTMREQGPFDGIVGFSQGAGMAAVVLALMRRAAEDGSGAADGVDAAVVRDARALPPLRFAFLFAGFYPDVPQFDALLTV
ncbi:Ovarian cancer-associated protein 2, partial [Coemansia sp. Benny D160-2]